MIFYVRIKGEPEVYYDAPNSWILECYLADEYPKTNFKIEAPRGGVSADIDCEFIPTEWLAKYAYYLHHETMKLGNKVIIDADTILADVMHANGHEWQDVGGALLKTYIDSCDKESVVACFELLNIEDITFREYLERCIEKTTRGTSCIA